MCGGLAVSLGLLPDQALLNDSNPHVINFYRHLQQGLVIDIPLEFDHDVFYANRDRFNELIADGGRDSAEAAQLLYYLNRSCWNGLTRFNAKGEFNVPIGRYPTVNYTRDWRHYAQVMSGWTFKHGDFEELTLAPDDFVYADPPYDVEFTRYTPDDFKWRDQERLAEWLAAHPGPVVVSNQKTDRIVQLYERHGFDLAFVESRRLIAADGTRRGNTVEVVGFRGVGFGQLPSVQTHGRRAYVRVT